MRALGRNCRFQIISDCKLPGPFIRIRIKAAAQTFNGSVAMLNLGRGISTIVIAGLLSLPLAGAAQTSAPQASSTSAESAKIAQLEAQVADAKSSADNAWMLVSAALVLLMTGPGLALFYGGLVRKKNILGTMMQSFAMMCLVTILWPIIGYSLAFSPGNAFIGGFGHVFLRNVSITVDPHNFYVQTIPEQTYMVYQLMFAIITPALITGAFAERMKFSAMALFLSLWSLLVYSPMAHMVWGVGGLLNSNGGRIPSLDFAGGTVVHVTSGVSALVTALYLGKRIGYPHTKMAPHSLVLSFIGACLLWVGWFGFNAGSALAEPAGHQRLYQHPLRHRDRGPRLDHLRVAAQRQANSPGLHLGRSRRAGGHHAGFRFCAAHGRAAIGLAAGFFCSFMVFKVKSIFGYDDSLDAFGVHGAGGTLGAILTGLFATSVINPIFTTQREARPRDFSRAIGSSRSINSPESQSPGASPSSAHWSSSNWSIRPSACASQPRTNKKASTLPSMARKATTGHRKRLPRKSLPNLLV